MKTELPVPVRILGIDPGSVRTGFGVIEQRGDRLQLVEFGSIGSHTSGEMPGRLVKIFAELDALIDRTEPNEVAVEGLFYAKNARSALILGHARGVALLAAARRGLAIAEYAPRAVKKALVGNGNAEKEQVESMVRLLLKVALPIRPLDAADGLAIAICHAHSRRLDRAVSGR